MWYENRENLVALANWLKDDGEWNDSSGQVNGKEYKDDPVRRVIYFLSKPWKWDKEWEDFQKKRSNELCQQKL